MKDKKVVLLLLGIILGLFLVSYVSAAAGSTTLVSPAASGSVSKNSLFNASITNVKGNFSCTFYAKSDSTANSSWSSITTLENTSATSAFLLVNTSGLEDSNDYSINATCGNESNIWTGGTNTGIRVDNTVPVAPSSLSPTDYTVLSSASTQTFSSTVTNARTTGCTYVIGRGGTSTSSTDTTSGTGTYSASSCSFTKTFSGTLDNGNWYWYVTASDGSNTTDSSVNLLQVQIAPTGGTPYSVVQKMQSAGTVKKTYYLADSAKENAPLIIGIVVVLGVIIFLVRRK